jgi:tripartite-type tricarboxylate transporter receptor subunit TctC
LIFSQIVGAEGIQFDLAKYSWIAKMSSDNRVLMVGTKTPYKTFDEILKASQSKPIVLSSSGLTSAAHVDALLLQEASGLKVKMISGYQGNDSDLAILRGEVDGGVGSYGSFKHFVDSGDGRVLLQIGREKDPTLPNIPNVTEVVPADKQAIAALIIADASLGRLVAAPPGIPPARREALIQAIKKTVADPDFQANAKKAELQIDPAYGDDVMNLVKASLNQSPADLKTLKDILGPAITGN